MRGSCGCLTFHYPAPWMWPVLRSRHASDARRSRRDGGSLNSTRRRKTERFRQNAKENGPVLGARRESLDRVLSRRDVDGQNGSIVALESRFVFLLCDCRMLCGRKVDGVGLVLRVWRIRGDPAQSGQLHELKKCAWISSTVSSVIVLVLGFKKCSHLQLKNLIRWPLGGYFTLQCHFWWGRMGATPTDLGQSGERLVWRHWDSQ